MSLLNRIAMALLLCLAGISLTGCGGEISNEVEPITWRTAKHVGGGDASILTITEFLGPKGAGPGRVYPGRYVLKGTYDLSNTKYDGGVITFGFLGSAAVKPEKGQTVHQVAKGQRKGTFELTMFITRWRDGPGTPYLSYAVGSDAHDSIELH